MNKIEIFENSLLKLIIRRGNESDRLNIILEEGELAYTTDTKRTYIGDGVTYGGNLIGNKFLGSATNVTAFAPGSPGDIAYDSDNRILYTLIENDGSNIADWLQVGNTLVSGNGTIYISTDNSISVGTLSAGNFSNDTVGSSLEIDTNSRISLSANISVDRISKRVEGVNSYLELPSKISINNINYTFPTTTPNQFEYLKGPVTGTQLQWGVPEIITTGVPTTTAALVPIGTIVPFVSSAAGVPWGWIVCDGSYVLRATYPDLFDLIGDSYGSTGGTDFAVPNYTNKTLYGDDDPISSDALGINTSSTTGLSATGVLFIIKAIGDYSPPSLTINSPLTATLNGSDQTGVPFNPLDGDVVIGGDENTIALPGLSAFKVAGTYNWTVPNGIKYIKYYVTGAGQYGGHVTTGCAAATCMGYLSASGGTILTIEVGARPPAENYGTGTDSLISISSNDLVISYHGERVEESPGVYVSNGGWISTVSPHVIAGEIIEGGTGGIDTNNEGDEESEGSSSFWGSCPAPGAGGAGHGSGDWGSNGIQSWPGDGMVLLEWS